MISRSLKHKISFLSNNGVLNDDWQIVIPNIFANIKPIYNNTSHTFDNINFGNLITEKWFVFKVRFRADIHDKMRILYNKIRYFEIKRIIDLNEESKIQHIITLEI